MRATLERYDGSHTFTRIDNTLFTFNYEPQPAQMYASNERGDTQETISGKRIIQTFGAFDCDREIILETFLKEDWAKDLYDARMLCYNWKFQNWQGIKKIVRFAFQDGLIIDWVNAQTDNGVWVFRTLIKFMVIGTWT